MTIPKEGKGKIVEKLFKKDFEKSYEEFNDIHFEFSKDEKVFMKFRNQIRLVFMIFINHEWILIFWNNHPIEKLLSAHKIQREFNEKSKSDSYCQQNEMKNLEKRLDSRMNKLENKLEEILSVQTKILTQLTADKS